MVNEYQEPIDCDFSLPYQYGEVVNTQPLHDAREERRKQLLDTIERLTLDEHKYVVMNAVRELLKLKK